jgi:cytochrome oxidase Cu insertion factor (SCO1/SenC/PrrC family)
MRKSTKVLIIVGAVVVLLAGVAWKMLQVPPPQIASNAGQLAAEFTLTDQNGQAFHLADERGHKVVLVFYRGYW